MTNNTAHTPEPIIKELTITLNAPLTLKKDVKVKIKQRITFNELGEVKDVEAIDAAIVEGALQ